MILDLSPKIVSINICTKNNLQPILKLYCIIPEIIHQSHVPSSYPHITLHVFHPDRLISTGALTPLSPQTAWISCMSVTKPYRRRGIGRLILSALCDRAHQSGFRVLILEITSTWAEVISFYQSFGFSMKPTRDEKTYFRLNLS